MSEKERFEVLREHMDRKIDVVLEGHQVLKGEIGRNREEARELNRKTNLKLDLIAQTLSDKIEQVDQKVEINREAINLNRKKIEQLDQKVEINREAINLNRKKIEQLDQKVEINREKIEQVDQKVDINRSKIEEVDNKLSASLKKYEDHEDRIKVLEVIN